MAKNDIWHEIVRDSEWLIQRNLNHCHAAHDLLSQSVQEFNVDMAISSELFRGRLTDKSENCAEGYSFDEISTTPCDGFLRAKINGVHT